VVRSPAQLPRLPPDACVSFPARRSKVRFAGSPPAPRFCDGLSGRERRHPFRPPDSELLPDHGRTCPLTPPLAALNWRPIRKERSLLLFRHVPPSGTRRKGSDQWLIRVRPSASSCSSRHPSPQPTKSSARLVRADPIARRARARRHLNPGTVAVTLCRFVDTRRIRIRRRGPPAITGTFNVVASMHRPPPTSRRFANFTVRHLRPGFRRQVCRRLDAHRLHAQLPRRQTPANAAVVPAGSGIDPVVAGVSSTT
jgi:hypothetical protein